MKKLKLKDLNVMSFTTTLEPKNLVGGGPVQITGDTCLCDPSRATACEECDTVVVIGIN